jgi:hypothetical protein
MIIFGFTLIQILCLKWDFIQIIALQYFKFACNYNAIVSCINTICALYTCLHEKAPDHTKKANRRSKDVVPLILNPGTGGRWAVNFTPQLLNQKDQQYPLNRRLGGPQS